MTNKGVAPADLTTPVGQLRVNLGDLSYVELEPPEPGFGDFANYSDAELEAFLTSANDNVATATGFAYMQLAAVYAVSGRDIKTDDLAISTKSRGSDLLQVAKSWLAEGAAQNAQDAVDYIDIVTPYPRPTLGIRPEGTPRAYSVM